MIDGGRSGAGLVASGLLLGDGEGDDGLGEGLEALGDATDGLGDELLADGTRDRLVCGLVVASSDSSGTASSVGCTDSTGPGGGPGGPPC